MQFRFLSEFSVTCSGSSVVYLLLCVDTAPVFVSLVMDSPCIVLWVGIAPWCPQRV